jgi:hypothetical protein
VQVAAVESDVAGPAAQAWSLALPGAAGDAFPVDQPQGRRSGSDTQPCVDGGRGAGRAHGPMLRESPLGQRRRCLGHQHTNDPWDLELAGEVGPEGLGKQLGGGIRPEDLVQ